jgi:putative transferase (TIGR04331 family)
MDAIVAKPYEQHFDLSAIFERLLFSLCDRLNDFHQTKFDVRYWRIILGHWLQRYVSVVFNRWQTLQQAFQNYDISTTIAFNSASFSLAMHDSISLIWACNDDFWNHILCVKIIESMGVKNLEMVKCEVELSPVNIQQNPRRHLIKTVISNALNLLSRDEDALIINSYLSKREEFKLQIALGQVPQLWSAPLPIQVLPDLELRQDLKFEVEAKKAMAH